jgi:hypothetical protein
MQYRVIINVATLLIMGVTAIGVFFALRKKEKPVCVCMGTHFPLPMTYAAFIENVSMALMAVVMIIWMLMPMGVSYAQTAASCH